MSGRAFDWKCHPEAEELIVKIIDGCCDNHPFIDQLSKDLLNKTSTRLFDWVDHIAVGYRSSFEEELEQCGFEADDSTLNYRVFSHPGAQLPRIVMYDEEAKIPCIAVKVDSISDFLMVRGINHSIEGSPYSSFRRCRLSSAFHVIERRGTRSMEPETEDSRYLAKVIEGIELWQARPRGIEDDDEAFRRTLFLAEELVRLLGKGMAAWVVLYCERSFWQSKNSAGQIQKNRQDRFGMGWANHDHHTFRSSRKNFSRLVRLFEMLGFHCRERFYAGEEAGWGAQVMESACGGFVLFLDVDLNPSEIQIDFAHHALTESEQLGTIGLWCALHGDSILSAGMHHLEAQFMFDELASDLQNYGIGMMAPFSHFTYLKQAFTTGEVWVVKPHRIEQLVNQKKISPHDADKFLSQGAIGSHLENLQRREGYKGFNQKNVSFIIKKTDPRTAM